MSNELTMERRSNLVMPSHYVELTEEEMSYVTGGVDLFTIPSQVAMSIGIAIATGSCIYTAVKHSAFFKVLPLTTLAVAGVLGHYSDRAMSALLLGRDVTVSANWWALLIGGGLGLAIGAGVGFLTKNLKWGIDSGLASFIVSSAWALTFSY